jgi:hypothetical protein
VRNRWWAAGYNIITIALVAGVPVPWDIVRTPATGAARMSRSTIVWATDVPTLRRAELPAAGFPDALRSLRAISPVRAQPLAKLRVARHAAALHDTKASHHLADFSGASCLAQLHRRDVHRLVRGFESCHVRAKHAFDACKLPSGDLGMSCNRFGVLLHCGHVVDHERVRNPSHFAAKPLHDREKRCTRVLVGAVLRVCTAAMHRVAAGCP